MSRSTECSICGNTDFALKEGLYYCTLCQTQSQNVIELDYSEMVDGAGLRAMQSTEKKIRKVDDRKPVKREVILPPYALYEAYAIILNKLGDSLIRLGLPKAIKESILRVYALYLRHRDVAFEDKNGPGTSMAPVKDLLGLLMPRDHGRHKAKPKKSTKRAVKLELDQYIPNPNATVDLTYVDVLGGSAGQWESTTSAPADVKRKRRNSAPSTVNIGSDDEASSDENNDERNKRIFDHGRIKPTFLIPICYLACVAVCPQSVFISDLMRWAKEGLLPIMNPHELLPERLDHPLIRKHFQESGAHYYLSRMNNLVQWGLERISILYGRSLWLSVYIGYTPNVTFDVDMLLAKYAYELNLTRCILPRARAVYNAAKFAHNVFNFNPANDASSRRSYAPVTPPEVATVAFLIVALKLTFGLDDRCEYIISQMADEFGRRPQSESQFSFSRWILQCKLRSAVVEGESVRRVLGRSWIDQRDTWMFNIQKAMEQDQKHHRPRCDQLVADDDEGDSDQDSSEATRKPRNDEVGVKELRELFSKFTPFALDEATDQHERGQYLNPLLETVEKFKIAQRNGKLKDNDMEKNNADVFCHDFFNDSLGFLEDSSVQKGLKKAMLDTTGIEIDFRSNTDIMFPCAKASVQLGPRPIVDYKRGKHFRILRMMNNEDEFEISKNMSWLLNFCSTQLYADLWVLFRAVQWIEMSLLDVKDRYHVSFRKSNHRLIEML